MTDDPSAFSVSIVLDDPTGRLTVRGEIDMQTGVRLAQAGVGVLAEGDIERLVVDLTGTTFMDSSGLRSLLQIRDAAETAGRSFAIVVSPGPVLRLLEVAGVKDWFEYE